MLSSRPTRDRREHRPPDEGSTAQPHPLKHVAQDDNPADSLFALLPDGYIALGFVASIKALDADGDVCLVNARSAEITRWEAIGMLTSAVDDEREHLRDQQGEPG